MAGSLASRGLAAGAIASSPSTDEDPRLIRALEAFLEAAEAGTPPNRAAFLAQHPEIASGLASCLDGLGAIHDILPPDPGPGPAATRDVASEPLESPELPIALGDYVLERELGRGGMGIVYAARQQSLGRAVAVKVLPFSATIDPRQLRRFRTEAQAAACLHHEHIVPVFAFGTDRAIPYYVMRLIEGRPLSALIDHWRVGDDSAPEAGGTRPPTAGSGPSRDPSSALAPPADFPEPADGRRFASFVASLGIQAAEALDHAHGQGVIHRDIKPANLLVDLGGHLWITDFGLARIRDQANVTRSGDLLGTLRYMSPEQALGRHAEVDHRSDLYSLGATLYEVLARAPLFESSDTQELINRVVNESPRPLRKACPGIPRDLETIVHKALAKDPRDRYPTAAALAEDLRRFRADLPIAARRLARTERLTRWARRYKAAVLTAAALMVVALLAQSVTIMMLAVEGRRSESHARRATETGLRLYDMADALYQQIAEELGPDPEEADTQRRLLETALGIYEQFAREAQDDPTLDDRLAAALRKAGDIHLRLGHHSEAALCYERAVDCLRSLGPAPPPDPQAEEDFAHVLNRLGLLSLVAGDPGRGAELLAQAIGLQEARVRRGGPIDDRLVLIQYLMDLGRLADSPGAGKGPQLALNRAMFLADELAERRTTSVAPPGTFEQAEALKRLIQGRLFRSDHNYADAEQNYRSALDLYRLLARQHPHRQEFRGRSSAAAMHLAWFLASCPDDSVRDEDAALNLVRRTLEHDPSNIDLQVQAGVFFLQADRHDDAELAFRGAMAAADDRADLHNNLAWLLATRPDDGRRDPVEAIRLAEEAIRREPNVGIYWNTLGVAHFRAGHLKEALASLEKSMELSDGGDGFDWFVVAMTLWKLGDRESASALYDRAVSWMELRPERDPTLNRIREEAKSTLEA